MTDERTAAAAGAAENPAPASTAPAQSAPPAPPVPPAQSAQSAPPIAPAPFGAPAAARNPYGTLGVVGFALSLLGPLSIAGLVVSIVALVQSKRRGFGNGFALAGIIIAGVGLLVAAVVIAVAVPALVDAAQTCARLGDGVHQIGDATYTCAPGSFSVHHDF